MKIQVDYNTWFRGGLHTAAFVDSWRFQGWTSQWSLNSLAMWQSFSSVCVYKCVCCVFVNTYKLFVFWRVSCVDFIRISVGSQS